MLDTISNKVDHDQRLRDELTRPDAVSTLIEEFNEKHFVVDENGKAAIYSPRYDPILERSRFDRHSKEDFRTFYMNRIIPVGTDEAGKVTYKSAAEIWLRHPQRRQYLGGVRFDPSNDCDPSVLNLWRGFHKKPAQGDWTLLREHLRQNLCRGDETHFRYLMGWMARMFQFAAKRAETAVVLRGKEGTGKGALANTLIKIIGHHAMHISTSSQLVGNFNGHLRDVVFLFADEAFFAGDRAHTGVLKALITEPYLTIEAKHQNAVQTPNFLHVLMASNSQWVVPASLESRRFFVLDVSDEHEQDHSYFDPIFEQLENGGCEGMLHDLLAYDLKGFNVRDIPVTNGLIEQRKQSLSTEHAWWMDCLQREYISRTDEDWPAWMDKDAVYESYLNFAEGRKERHVMSREILGKFLMTMGCTPYKKTIQLAAVLETDKKTRRVQGYNLANLQSTRMTFCSVTKLPVDWQHDEETDTDNEPGE